jgi:hypothetical protein
MTAKPNRQLLISDGHPSGYDVDGSIFFRVLLQIGDSSSASID